MQKVGSDLTLRVPGIHGCGEPVLTAIDFLYSYNIGAEISKYRATERTSYVTTEIQDPDIFKYFQDWPDFSNKILSYITK